MSGSLHSIGKGQQQRELTPEELAAKQAAIDAGREAVREEGRAQVRAEREQWADVIAKAAAKPLEAAHAAALKKDAEHYKAHLKAVREGRVALGVCIGLVVGSIASSAGIAYVFRDAQLLNASARAIEQRGGQDVLPAPRICDPALDDCGPDTNTRDSGYERPGREPRSAER